MFMNFYFCWNKDFFFYFQLLLLFFCLFVFFTLEKHYIGFFENSIVYSGMRSTSVNMLSANWGETPGHFDKNGIFFFLGGSSFHSESWRMYLLVLLQSANSFWLKSHFHQAIVIIKKKSVIYRNSVLLDMSILKLSWLSWKQKN